MPDPIIPDEQPDSSDNERVGWPFDVLTFIRRTRINRQEAASRMPRLENGVRDPWLDRYGLDDD